MVTINYPPGERWRWVCNAKTAGPAKAVLFVLAEHANQETLVAWPSVDTMAKESGLHRTTVIRALQQLVEDGWVEVVERKHRKSTVYRITMDAEFLSSGERLQPVIEQVINRSTGEQVAVLDELPDPVRQPLDLSFIKHVVKPMPKRVNVEERRKELAEQARLLAEREGEFLAEFEPVADGNPVRRTEEGARHVYHNNGDGAAERQVRDGEWKDGHGQRGTTGTDRGSGEGHDQTGHGGQER